MYIQAAAISHQIPGILCIKRSSFSFAGACALKRLLNVIPFHVLTGCDTNSCLFGHGKISLYEKLSRSAEARRLISKCGESLTLSDDALNDLKLFVIKYTYEDTQSSALNQAHASNRKS